MKEDYDFDTLHIPIVVRVFPKQKKDLDQLFIEHAPRWANESEMIRAMITHSLQCKHFLEVKQ